ncbi:Uma2 family endonuclease [Nocardioides sp. LHD-245]|uniref:Uma2 family endonuclease n=1 Tax=Nocardioides sp. LHD-245 TaxID=3051387 RepID=UPI0027E0C555|nr:Uma2 family endonuclease [Nocardioides sp. LHD-245]
MTSLSPDADLLAGIPVGRALTALDVAELTGEGARYELIDGVLTEMAGCSPEHQDVVMHLSALLFGLRPPGLKVLPAPFDIIDNQTAVQPDIVVITKKPIAAHGYVEGPPLLAVEVLSPSTALYDLNTKFKRYERAGVASYWVIDPVRLRLIAWELRDGAYVEIADVTGDESWSAELPFPVTITPADLVD